MRNNNKYGVLCALILAGALLLAGCRGEGRGEAPPATVAVPTTFETVLSGRDWTWKIRDFGNGVALVEQGGSYGYLSVDGVWITGIKWQDAKRFSEGYAAVKAPGPDGALRWGYIDKTGKFAVDPAWAAAWPFKAGKAVVRDGAGRLSAIDEHGDVVEAGPESPTAAQREAFLLKYTADTPPTPAQAGFLGRYAHNDGFVGSYAVVYNAGGLCNVIDRQGNECLRDWWDAIKTVKNEIAPIKQAGKWGYIFVPTNTVLAIPQFDDATVTSGGRAFAKKDGVWGIIRFL